jgi:hypothetical protein
MPESQDPTEKLAKMSNDELFDWLLDNPNEIQNILPYLPGNMKIISENPLAINCFEYAFVIGEGNVPKDKLVETQPGKEGSVVVYYTIDWGDFLESVKSGITVISDKPIAPSQLRDLERGLNYPEAKSELWELFNDKIEPFITSPIHAGIVKSGGIIESQWGNQSTAPIIQHDLQQVPSDYKVYGTPVVRYLERPV